MDDDEMTAWYSVEDEPDRIEFGLDPDDFPPGIDPDADLFRAEEMAAHFHCHHDRGYEWPITIHLYAEENGPSVAKFRVDLISRPGFNATAI